jgi:hypothetical protein
VNTTLLHRRRIERYAQLLDEAIGERPSSHARSSLDAELNDLVMLSDRVAYAAPDVEMRTDRRAEIRATLMETAEQDGIGVTATATGPSPAVGRARVGSARKAATKTSGHSGKRARVSILVGVAVGTLALSGISAASGDALPGDALYSLKLSQESAQLALAGSGTAKGRLYLHFASTRVDEAQSIRTNSHKLNDALAAADKDTRLGMKLLLTAALTKHDTSALATVDQFLQNQGRKLDELRNQVVGPDRYRVLASLLTGYSQRTAEIKSAIACGGTTIIRSDEFGPVPAGCAESTPVTPAPTHAPTGGSTGGKPSDSNHKAGQPSSATTPGGPATSGGKTGTAPNGDLVTDAPATPTPTDTDSGLLGDIGHVLGGLLGH